MQSAASKAVDLHVTVQQNGLDHIHYSVDAVLPVLALMLISANMSSSKNQTSGNVQVLSETFAYIHYQPEGAFQSSSK